MTTILIIQIKLILKDIMCLNLYTENRLSELAYILKDTGPKILIFRKRRH